MLRGAAGGPTSLSISLSFSLSLSLSLARSLARSLSLSPSLPPSHNTHTHTHTQVALDAERVRVASLQQDLADAADENTRVLQASVKEKREVLKQVDTLQHQLTHA